MLRSEWIVNTLLSAAGLALISGCGNSDSPLQVVDSEVTDSAGSEPLELNTGPLDVYNELVLPTVAPEIGAALASNDSLLANGDLEDGTNGWFDCKGSSNASLTTDASSGSAALAVTAENCVFASTEALSPGDEIVLTCDTKISDSSLWAGLGLGFSSAEWESIASAPTTLVTSTKYTSYSISTTVPFDTKYTTLWFYSNSDASIDNCQITPAKLDDKHPPDDTDTDPTDPTPTGENLLSSAEGFIATNSGLGIQDWHIGCATNGYHAQSPFENTLELGDKACVAQSLDAEDITALRGNDFLFECVADGTTEIDPLFELDGNSLYSDIVIGFNGIETAESNRENGIFRISGTAPASLTNGFVGIYSELPGYDPLFVESCSLTVVSVNTTEPDDPVVDTATLDYRLNSGQLSSDTIDVLQLTDNEWTPLAEIAAPAGSTFTRTFPSADPEKFFARTSTGSDSPGSLLYYGRDAQAEWNPLQTISADSRQPFVRDFIPIYDGFASDLSASEEIMVITSRIGVASGRTVQVHENQLDIYENNSGVWQHVKGIDRVYPDRYNIIKDVTLVNSDEIRFSTYPYADYQTVETAVLKRNEGGENNWGLAELIPEP